MVSQLHKQIPIELIITPKLLWHLFAYWPNMEIINHKLNTKLCTPLKQQLANGIISGLFACPASLYVLPCYHISINNSWFSHQTSTPRTPEQMWATHTTHTHTHPFREDLPSNSCHNEIPTHKRKNHYLTTLLLMSKSNPRKVVELRQYHTQTIKPKQQISHNKITEICRTQNCSFDMNKLAKHLND